MGLLHAWSSRHAAAMACGASICTLFQPALADAQNPAETRELPAVEVITVTPLPGLGIPLRDVPANVQVHTSKDIRAQEQSNIGEYLEQNATSVTINSSQGNPFQADINFRGFTASPVLGAPQGISVFQDGVRINEPFGDVVNWDLIPRSAISSIQLLPGSNPAFGLNTLGGALAINTKSGRQYPGSSVQAYGGSFGRKGTEFEFGGVRDRLDYFVTGNYVDDHGWAEHNPSTVQQFFGKVGWRDARTDLNLSLTLANNRLEGTQTLPASFFDNIRQPYTWPDINRNKLAFLTGKGSHFVSDKVLIDANAYYRKYRNENLSSNVNANFGAIDPDTGLPDTTQATNDRSVIDQDSFGLGAQITLSGKLAGRDNQLALGTSADFGRASFIQDSQLAEFNPDRSAVGISDFIQGTNASTRNTYYGLFLSDSLKLNPQWTLSASGRYNWARVKIEDRSGTAPGLNAEHTFSRFNPAVGINFNPNQLLTVYASYNEGMRSPTPIELACADPNAPCKLPNNFLSDPPLRPVVSRTIETGMRGRLDENTAWSLAVYRTELSDDIQFISAGGAATNIGFFQNVGNTLRRGIEASLGSKWGKLSATARYSYVDATFQSPFIINSPSNSSANAIGDIQVQPGNRIPGIPRQSVKLRLQYDWNTRSSVGMNVNYSGSVFARGDENNQDVHGTVPSYTVVNLDGRYAVSKKFEVFASIVNLFDRRYANFGILGQNFFNGPGKTFDGVNPTNEQFLGPGVPRGAWVGIRYNW